MAPLLLKEDFMKSFVISKNDAGQRLDKFVLKAAKGLSKSLMYKYIRKKYIKVNKKRAEINYMLLENDVVEMYINDEFFKEKNTDFKLIAYKPDLKIVYEDENVLLVDKKAGVIVHSDDNEGRDTLINQVLLYLYQKGEYLPEKENSFTPSLCNRLDKNTGGIVIVAKNAVSQRELYEIIKKRQIKKLYFAMVKGVPTPKSATISGYLKKDSQNNIVTVKDEPFEDAKQIKTKYKVLMSKNGYSLVEVDLITGRTHQIRAHMAHIGHCVVGDTKYGRLKDFSDTPFKHQALYSYSLSFEVEPEYSLSYLNGKIFNVEEVYFLDFFINSKKVSKIK